MAIEPFSMMQYVMPQPWHIIMHECIHTFQCLNDKNHKYSGVKRKTTGMNTSLSVFVLEVYSVTWWEEPELLRDRFASISHHRQVSFSNLFAAMFCKFRLFLTSCGMLSTLRWPWNLLIQTRQISNKTLCKLTLKVARLCKIISHLQQIKFDVWECAFL